MAPENAVPCDPPSTPSQSVNANEHACPHMAPENPTLSSLPNSRSRPGTHRLAGVAMLAGHLRNWRQWVVQFGRQWAHKLWPVGLVFVESEGAWISLLQDEADAPGAARPHASEPTHTADHPCDTAHWSEHAWAQLFDSDAEPPANNQTQPETPENTVCPNTEDGFAHDAPLHADETGQTSWQPDECLAWIAQRCETLLVAPGAQVVAESQELVEAARHLVVAATGQAEEMIDTYRVLKGLSEAAWQGADVSLFVCGAATEEQARQIHRKLSETAFEFLGMQLGWAGWAHGGDGVTQQRLGSWQDAEIVFTAVIEALAKRQPRVSHRERQTTKEAVKADVPTVEQLETNVPVHACPTTSQPNATDAIETEPMGFSDWQGEEPTPSSPETGEHSTAGMTWSVCTWDDVDREQPDLAQSQDTATPAQTPEAEESTLEPDASPVPVDELYKPVRTNQVDAHSQPPRPASASPGAETIAQPPAPPEPHVPEPPRILNAIRLKTWPKDDHDVAEALFCTMHRWLCELPDALRLPGELAADTQDNLALVVDRYGRLSLLGATLRHGPELLIQALQTRTWVLQHQTQLMNRWGQVRVDATQPIGLVLVAATGVESLRQACRNLGDIPIQVRQLHLVDCPPSPHAVVI